MTDIMPLRGQNRILVVSALRLFRKAAPIGLRELLDRASRFVTPTLGARDFGFLIGPRINAAGRMETGRLAVDLLKSTELAEAMAIGEKINANNNERKNIDKEITCEAIEMVRAAL